MGRMVTCAVIVAAMVAFAIFGYNYSDNRAKEIYITADGITQAIDNDDKQKAAEMAAYAEISGEGFHRILSSLRIPNAITR